MTALFPSTTYLGRIPDYDHILTRLGITTVDKTPYTSPTDVTVPCKTQFTTRSLRPHQRQVTFGHEGQIMRLNVGWSRDKLCLCFILMYH